MGRSAKPPKRTAYFDALQRIFQFESEVLTAALPHSGERGRNDEDRARAFLSRVLPKKFSLGTGFLLCSDPTVAPSRQNDIVIYDDFNNSPLNREIAANVFPVEAVYGTVEVKGRLTTKDLHITLLANAHIRTMANHKMYVGYGATGPKGKQVVQTVDIAWKTKPRAFIYAYDCQWRTPDKFKAAFISTLARVPGSHIHGCIVVNKGWYAYQKPYTDPAHVEVHTDAALLRFVSNMTHSLASFPMAAAAMDRYVHV
jgi:hypothetical protein